MGHIQRYPCEWVIVWFLSCRLKSKLAEVEDRHVMSGIRDRKRLDESE